mgnify:CR=1 FL=1
MKKKKIMMIMIYIYILKIVKYVDIKLNVIRYVLSYI